MKITFIILIFSILFLSCKKENTIHFSKNKDIDSLLVVASSTNDTKLKLKISNNILDDLKKNELDFNSRKNYLALARIYFSLNDLRYVEICKFLVSNSPKKLNHYEISFCNFLLGNYYYKIANYEKSYFHLSKAEKSFIILKNKLYTGYSLSTKADILTFKKDFVGADVLSVKALKIAKSLKNDELIYGCYLTLGNSSNGLNNYEKAREYYLKSIISVENLKSHSNYISYKLMPLVYISNIYLKQKKYQEAIEVAKKGLASKKIDKLIFCYLTNSFAYSKFKLGDKSSLPLFLKTLKIGDSLKFEPIQITSKTYLGEFYLAKKDTTKAVFYLKEAQSQAHKNNIFEDELKILQLLAQANPNDKYFYSNRYIALNDSLQNVERASRDKFARIEFETDEIVIERNSLSLEKEYLSFQRLVILGISILSIIIIVLWFMNKSQKAKTRELLLKQEQQKANEEIYQLMIDQQQKIEEGKNIEKQRISLDLHDSVMGKLTAVRLNLYVALLKNNLADDVDLSKQIDEIQEVEKEIRAIAHDLNSNLFSDNANFISVVQQLFNKIENHSQLQFNLQVSDALNWDLVSNSIKINLYRILQEALQNIEKYANATQVTIVMTLSDANQIAIEISDDGNGFDTSKKSLGIGLKNIQFRIEEIKGTFTIQSEIGKGTKINLTIPL